MRSCCHSQRRQTDVKCWILSSLSACMRGSMFSSQKTDIWRNLIRLIDLPSKYGFILSLYNISASQVYENAYDKLFGQVFRFVGLYVTA